MGICEHADRPARQIAILFWCIVDLFVEDHIVRGIEKLLGWPCGEATLVMTMSLSLVLFQWNEGHLLTAFAPNKEQ